jgi:hypothetical protein
MAQYTRLTDSSYQQAWVLSNTCLHPPGWWGRRHDPGPGWHRILAYGRYVRGEGGRAAFSDGSGRLVIVTDL